MKNLIRDTIDKIEKQRITPEPKWKYLMKKYSLWLLFAVVSILAALSFSVVFDTASNLDWDLYRFTRQGRFLYFLSIIPYFWIILVVAFLAVAFFEIRRTETGYRYSWSKILLITLGSIAIFGSFVSLFGFGGRLNSKLSHGIPFYSQHMTTTKESQWMQPSKGFLAGTIISVEKNKLEIEDLNDKRWNINLDKETSIRPSANISQNEMIKIIGEKKDEENFRAQEIRPWMGRGMGSGQHRRPTDDDGNLGGRMRWNNE